MSSLQPNLVRFFENVPLIPLTEVVKHFEDSDLIKLSVLSPNFLKAVSPRKIDGFAVLQLNIVKSEINIEITPSAVELIKKRKREEIIVIRFLDSNSDKESIDNDKTLWIHRKEWKTQGNRLILEISHSICGKFSMIFRTSETENSMWMTREDLLKVNCQFKHFGANQFTDKDFNAFLHSWMAGNPDKMQHYSFEVGDDVKIEEVIRGLITDKWDPEKRDRKYMTYSPAAIVQPLIDMADGYDISRPCSVCGQLLGTVQLIENTLHIVAWFFPIRLKFNDWYHFGLVIFYNRELQDQSISDEERESCKKMRIEHLESLRNIREDPMLEVEDLELPEGHDEMYS